MQCHFCGTAFLMIKNDIYLAIHKKTWYNGHNKIYFFERREDNEGYFKIIEINNDILAFVRHNDKEFVATVINRGSEKYLIESPSKLYNIETGRPISSIKTNSSYILKCYARIDDTIIDYPVMQTSNNEYYLDHNFNQEYDKNGSIFMDPVCDVLKPSTNLILYGHHMKSGKMFGDLNKYESEQYMKAHSRIKFDTIYEKAEYQVMYVFRDSLKQDTEITFKYYQFIDSVSEQEFDSNMREMAALSMYDTGVTARYGDQLLTLSTCDYQEQDGRFVVVAKKIN